MRFKCALEIDDIYVRFSVINVSTGSKSIVRTIFMSHNVQLAFFFIVYKLRGLCLTRRCSFNPAESWSVFYASGSLAVSKSVRRTCGINLPFPICIYISISAAMEFHRSSGA